MIALLKTRQRKIAVAAALSLTSLFAGSRWLFSRVTPVDRDRATQEFRQERSHVDQAARSDPTASTNASVPPSSLSTSIPLQNVQIRERGHVLSGALDRPVEFRPLEGTYEYDTDGFESVTGGYKRTFPETSYRNVIYQGATKWQEHHIFMEERHFWNDMSFDGNGRLIHSTRQLAWWGSRGIKIDRTIIFDPRGSLLPWREGRTWQGRFEGDTYGTYTAVTRQHDWYRRFVIDGEPVLTGMIAVGDSWACTNPTAGRGLSLGVAHAVALRDAARTLFDSPRDLALEFDRATEDQLTPWYRQQVQRDHARVATIQAVLEGRDPPKPDLTNPMVRASEAFQIAAAHDPDVARAFVEMLTVLALPSEIMSRPGMLDKVFAAAEGREVLLPAGPSREELVALLED